MASQKKHIALDIGSSQITCMVGNVSSDGHVNVHATTVRASDGIEKGNIVDMEKAVKSLKHTIKNTEHMIGRSIHSVTVASSGLNPKSHWVMEEVIISDKKVKDIDIKRLLNVCKKKVATEETPIIHVTPYYYSVDGVETTDPVGMFGKVLKVNIHMTTCQQSTLENLKILLDRCSLNIESIVVDSYASALGIMDPEEKDLSSMVLDIGGGSSSWSIFYNGKFVSTGSITLGGDHITNDIMKITSTTRAEAQRLKIKHGSAMVGDIPSMSGVIEYHRAGEQDGMPYTIKNQRLAEIMQNRLEKIFDKITVEIRDFNFAKRLILTGGTADIENIRQLATSKLKRNVRVAKPIRALGLQMYNTPCSSVAVGLLRYASQTRLKEEVIIISQPEIYEGSLPSRIWHWLKNEI